MKLKIFIGYAMLILLLGFIIYLFRGERMKRDELKWEMKELGINTRPYAQNLTVILLELGVARRSGEHLERKRLTAIP